MCIYDLTKIVRNAKIWNYLYLVPGVGWEVQFVEKSWNVKTLFCSWTLNRNGEGHTQEQQTLIDDKIAQFCMDPTEFKEMKRSWPCSDFGLFIGGFRGGRAPAHAPLRVQILSFWHTKFAKCNCLGSPRPPYEVHAPPYGKSWIRHCCCFSCMFIIFSCTRGSPFSRVWRHWSKCQSFCPVTWWVWLHSRHRCQELNCAALVAYIDQRVFPPGGCHVADGIQALVCSHFAWPSRKCILHMEVGYTRLLCQGLNCAALVIIS